MPGADVTKEEGKGGRSLARSPQFLTQQAMIYRVRVVWHAEAESDSSHPSQEQGESQSFVRPQPFGGDEKDGEKIG